MIADIAKNKRIDFKLCLLILLCIIRLCFYYFQPGTAVKLDLYSEKTFIPLFVRLLKGYKSLFLICKDQLNLLLSIKIFPFLLVFAVIFARKLYTYNIFKILINAVIPLVSLFIVITIMSFAYRYIIPNIPHIYNVINILFTFLVCILLITFISLFISCKFSFEISTFCFKLDFIKSIDFSDNQESFKESIVLSIFQFSSKLPESFLKISSGKIFFSF